MQTILDAIQSMEQRLNERMDKLDTKIDKVQDLLLDEIGKTQDYLERRIDKLDSKMDDVIAEYRIARIDTDTIKLLTRRMDRLEEEQDKIKARLDSIA